VVQTFKRETLQRRRLILHNASPEPIELRYDGTLYSLPPKDVTKLPDEFGSEIYCGYDKDGDPIPGTVGVIDSTMVRGADYESIQSHAIDAELAVSHMLGVGKDGSCNGIYAQMGVSFIPDGSSKEEIQEIIKAGERRAVKFRLKNALHVVAVFERGNERRKQNGLEALTTDPSYRRALRDIDAARKMEEEDELAKGITREEEQEMESVSEELGLFASMQSELKKIAESELDKYLPEATHQQKADIMARWLENPSTRAKLDRLRKFQQIKKIPVRKPEVKDSTPQSVSLKGPKIEVPQDEPSAEAP
jgi:hypothetical protein